MKDLLIGAGYVFISFKDLLHPKIRAFVLWPLLINIAVFILAFYWGYETLAAKLQTYEVSQLPSWLSWMEGFWGWIMSGIRWLLTAVWVILFLFAFSLIGSITANLFASPFNGLLCEKMDLHFYQYAAPNRSIYHLIISSIARELRKWLYYLPRFICVGLVCLILFFIPVINVLSTVLLYLFGCWMLAFQYLDYPADNRHCDIQSLKASLKTNKMLTYGFGMGVYVITLIPIVNFLILPLATIAATKLWAERYSKN